MKQIWNRYVFRFRVLMTELLFSWAITWSPPGYTPSYIASITDAYHRRGEFSDERLAGSRKAAA